MDYFGKLGRAFLLLLDAPSYSNHLTGCIAAVDVSILIQHEPFSPSIPAIIYIFHYYYPCPLRRFSYKHVSCPWGIYET